MMKRSLCQEDIAILNVHAPNNRPAKYVRQQWIDRKNWVLARVIAFSRMSPRTLLTRPHHRGSFFVCLFVCLFLAVLGLRFCVRAFSSCGERGPLFIAVHGPLTIAASLVVEHRLQTRRLSSCGSRAQLLRGMWNLPGPGLEPVSPALAGGFSTTAPPGKRR